MESPFGQHVETAYGHGATYVTNNPTRLKALGLVLTNETHQDKEEDQGEGGGVQNPSAKLPGVLDLPPLPSVPPPGYNYSDPMILPPGTAPQQTQPGTTQPGGTLPQPNITPLPPLDGHTYSFNSGYSQNPIATSALALQA